MQYPLPGTGLSPVHWPATLQDAPSPGAVPPPRYRTFPGALACYITGRPLSRCSTPSPVQEVQYPLPGTGRSPVHWPATPVHWPATLQDAPSPGAVPPPRYRKFPGALACYITGRPLSRCSTPSPVQDVPRCIGLLHYRTPPLPVQYPSPVQDVPRCIGLLHYRTPPLPVQYPLPGTGRSPVHWPATLQDAPSPGAVPPSPVQDVPRCIGLLHYRTPPLPVQYPLLGTGRSPVHWLATLQNPPPPPPSPGAVPPPRYRTFPGALACYITGRPLSRCCTPSPVQDVPRCIGLLHYRTSPLPVQYPLPGTGRSPVHWPATLQQKAMQMCKSLDKAHQT